MILGRGDIASIITDRKDVTFFACGVSDSSCQDEAKFLNEKILLLAQPKNKHLVYFSSLCTFYNSNTPYAIHKKKMEALIKEQFMCYTIFKIGNITWGTHNKNTIINNFKIKIANKEDFEVRDELRYLISKEHLQTELLKIKIGDKEIRPVTGRTVKVSQIVDEILQKKL